MINLSRNLFNMMNYRAVITNVGPFDFNGSYLYS